MYSDNGTTFQGADKDIAQSFRAATRDTNFLNKLATDQISWKFIPPAAPHFGGLWEAGVRSTKHHMKRVIGSHTLTFEEFTTILCQIEACLNSRPLAPASDHVDDYSAITPGHFLIGSALNAVPAPTLLDVRENRLSRWQLLRQLSESFWRAWSADYLHTLQQRPKWRISTNLAKPGRIVLIKNSLAPPTKWNLGRILRCHPGHDGISRVVTVRTAQGEYKRPITQLCFLPVEINNEEAELNSSAGGNKENLNGTS
ncbi:uncharacterized protein LOC143213645 [Lasioglossum baleicum]|uniref:uncharacterized protein LOC143213645 n=1 Tax=Lasioglossum baleicum TaxID=434251 RepID=UPI003FCCD1F8